MRFVSTLLQAVLGFAVITLAWWLGANLAQANRTNPQVFPGPAAVANKAAELIATDAFQQHIWSSLMVLAYGLAPALLVAIILGAAAGSAPLARWLFGPVLITIAAAPVVVLLPLLVGWIGLTITPKIVLVFLVAMFPAANTILVRWPKGRAAKDDVEDEDELRSMRPPRRVAAILAGLRIGVIFGVTALVIAELVASNTGLGYFVMMSGSLFNTTEALAAALVVAIPTIVTGVLLQAIEEQLAG